MTLEKDIQEIKEAIKLLSDKEERNISFIEKLLEFLREETNEFCIKPEGSFEARQRMGVEPLTAESCLIGFVEKLLGKNES